MHKEGEDEVAEGIEGDLKSVHEYPPIEYPPRLPRLMYDSPQEDSTFTAVERIALKNAWRILKQDFRRHALQIYEDFFVLNETMLERFRKLDGVFDVESLVRHPHQLMHVYQKFIEDVMMKPPKINRMLTKMRDTHWKLDVTKADVEMMTVFAQNYFLDVLHDISSPTLGNAFARMGSLIARFHDKENPITALEQLKPARKKFLSKKWEDAEEERLWQERQLWRQQEKLKRREEATTSAVALPTTEADDSEADADAAAPDLEPEPAEKKVQIVA